MKGKGNEAYGVPAGDLVFQVTRKQHSFYNREGSFLIVEKEIDLNSALHGLKMKLPSLDSSKKEIEVSFGEEVILPDEFKRIRGLGMPVANSSRYGDLFTRFRIKFPKWYEINSSKVLEKGPETKTAESGSYSEKGLVEMIKAEKMRSRGGSGNRRSGNPFEQFGFF